ncbi:putative Hydroxymethylglutaryl-CoA reductase (NADPH) [Vibrio nigripulchritudo SOn1]|uniref:hydroxymethylglutaryl-CoA reductase (NADPH) n=1 Tax=Vibrio nigripulchritudo SOn1 TaxID=1238450 RepID=A0AAV2VQU1_9VIBR|nr:phosphotransferase [Vibrio nigripulchritudo]CCO46915.1 putative Hydroxymethylglutaryl-CoA reductase (NADPH) [Vibrio nigripulchritudo SOn1]
MPASEKMKRRLPTAPGYAQYKEDAIQSRLDWCEQVSETSLSNVSRSHLDPQTLAGNIENYIGAVHVPIGLAGPVKINGEYINGYVPVPIATTEGCLVSSICRGAKACELGGGIDVHVIAQNMVRAPAFICDDMASAVALQKWVEANHSAIAEKAESVSSVAKLTRIEPQVFGDSLHLRFCYETADAAGQNMTSATTWIACEWIMEQLNQLPHIGVKQYLIEGNMAGDKKVNALSLTRGRGVSVTAHCRIPDSVLKRILRVTSDQLVESWHQGEIGAACAGMVSTNLNFANVVAGIFTATGQDIACVHESSLGTLKARKDGDAIVISVYMPSLVIGTVGGGTGLPTQNECLSLMGCAGKDKVKRLAEIIAATCLCLDLSTGAAIVSNEFVQAHERLGRNRPKPEQTLSAEYFNQVLYPDYAWLEEVRKVELDTNNGVINTLVSNTESVYGIHRLAVDNSAAEKMGFETFIAKIKPHSDEIKLLGAQLAHISGDDTLSGLYQAQAKVLGFDNAHRREIALFSHLNALGDTELLALCPQVYGSHADDKSQLYTLLMEDLSHCSHLDTINMPTLWQEKEIKTALRGLAKIHASYFDNLDALEPLVISGCLDKLCADSLLESKTLLNRITEYNHQRYPDLVSESIVARVSAFIDSDSTLLKAMSEFPLCLSHNDFNIRNLALRHTEAGTQLVAYDWELACIQNPQRDVIEFLISVIDQVAGNQSLQEYIEYYRGELQALTGYKCESKSFCKVLLGNAIYLFATRFNAYLMTNNVFKLEFIDRLTTNLLSFIDLLEGQQSESQLENLAS